MRPKQKQIQKSQVKEIPLPKFNIEDQSRDGGRKNESVKTKAKHGHFEWPYWVWKSGAKSHVRFIGLAIRRMQALPLGFYEEAKKLPQCDIMVHAARQLNLKDIVDK